MVDFGIAKWHHHKLLNSMAWIFSTYKIIVFKFSESKTWQIMCGYLIVVIIVAKKKKPNCKYYTNGQRMNMYMLRVYIIYGAFDDIMLSHDL
jgi:hypothetical protein